MIRRFQTSKFKYVLNAQNPMHDDFEGAIFIEIERPGCFPERFAVNFKYRSNRELLRELRRSKFKLKQWIKNERLLENS